MALPVFTVNFDFLGSDTFTSASLFIHLHPLSTPPSISNVRGSKGPDRKWKCDKTVRCPWVHTLERDKAVNVRPHCSLMCDLYKSNSEPPDLSCGVLLKPEKWPLISESCSTPCAEREVPGSQVWVTQIRGDRRQHESRPMQRASKGEHRNQGKNQLLALVVLTRVMGPRFSDKNRTKCSSSSGSWRSPGEDPVAPPRIAETSFLFKKTFPL